MPSEEHRANINAAMTIERSNMNDRNTISDGVILLRPFRVEDAEQHVAGDDLENIRWLNEGKKSTLETTIAWIKQNQINWEKGFPRYNWAITDQKSGALYGMIDANAEISQIEGLIDGDANISYSLDPSARGRGLITKALTLVERFLKEKGVKRACLRIDPNNAASNSVAVRAGYTEMERIVTADGEVFRFFVKLL